MSKAPKYSLCVFVYNEEKYIKRTLNSILAQDFMDMEFVISDNCSTDGTWEIIKEYARDPRFKIHRQEYNKGSSNNLLECIKIASGEYISFLGGHDYLGVDFMKHIDLVSNAYPDASLISPRISYVNERGALLRKTQEVINTTSEEYAIGRVFHFYQKMDRCNSFYGFFKRCDLNKTMPWIQRLNYDFGILMRIAALGDIITADAAMIYRTEKNKKLVMNTSENLKRQEVDHGLTLSSRPILNSKLQDISEAIQASGPAVIRLKILLLMSWRMLLRPSQVRILLRELFAVKLFTK